MLSLGDRLHKTLDEIAAMTVDEFNLWLGFYELRKERS